MVIFFQTDTLKVPKKADDKINVCKIFIVKPPRKVTSSLEQPIFNFPKLQFYYIFDSSITVSSLQQPLLCYPWVDVLQRLHCIIFHSSYLIYHLHKTLKDGDFSFQNNPRNLWNCLGKVKLALQQNFIGLISHL